MRPFPALALVLGLTLTLIIGPVPADARPQDGPMDGSGHVVSMPKTGSGWYGAYQMGQTTGYCGDLMSAPPRRATGWTEAPAGSPLLKQVGLADAAPLPHGNGEAVASSAELADIAWVLTQTGEAPPADIGAAVEHFVRLRTLSGAEQAAREAVRWSAVTAAHSAAMTEFDRLTREAALFAGPYTAQLSWDRPPSLTEPTGTLLASVESRAGNAVPGVSIRVEGSGALTVAQTSAITGDDGQAALEVSMELPGADPSTGAVAATFSGLPGTAPRVFVPAESTVQRLLVAPDRLTVTGTADATLAPSFTPRITTRTRDVVALAGESAVDLVSVSGGRPGATFEGASTLYGPFATLDALSAATPATAPRVGTARFSGRYGSDGAAEVVTEGLIFPGAGYFTWVESLEPSEFVTAPAASPWPQLSETSLVLSPVVGTELTPHGTATAGVVASDSLRLDGVPGLAVPDSSALTVRASGRLVGPVPPRRGDGGATCDAVDWSEAATVEAYERVELTELAATGFELTGLAAAPLTTPGCYSAEATVTLTHASRKPVAVHHALGHPSQTVLITEAPAPAPKPSPSPLPTQSPTPSPTSRPTAPAAVPGTRAPGTLGLPSTGW